MSSELLSAHEPPLDLPSDLGELLCSDNLQFPMHRSQKVLDLQAPLNLKDCLADLLTTFEFVLNVKTSF